MPGGAGNVDGTASPVRFTLASFGTASHSTYGPVGLAVDGLGNVYVADTGNSTIRKITPAGEVTTIAGSAGQSGSEDGPGNAARFNLPTAVVVDGSGNLYVADSLNHTIRKITPDRVVTTLAGAAGQPGSDDGIGSAARFKRPTGVTRDSAGNVFVADKLDHTIRRISADG